MLECLPNGSGRKTVEFCHSGVSRNLARRLILLDSGLRRNDGILMYAQSLKYEQPPVYTSKGNQGGNYIYRLFQASSAETVNSERIEMIR